MVLAHLSLKVFIEFVTVLFLLFLYSVFLGREACGIFIPQTGIELASPVLKGKVLITGLQNKSLPSFFLNPHINI